MKSHTQFLKMAVEEATAGIRAREGGPFGAVIVRDGKVIGRGHNSVISSNDPTAHAEINAIRNACMKEKKPHLTGAVLYSNFEPCPMCLAAIYWADIRTVIFCSGQEQAEKLGLWIGICMRSLPGIRKRGR
jgi:guanine deaminase